MGDLLIHMPYSEVTATLEKMASCGVCTEDFAYLRRYDSCLKKVSESLKELREILEKVYGTEKNLALEALERVHDPHILIDIVRHAVRTEVQLRAIARIEQKDCHLLYDTARLSNSLDVVRAAVKRLGWSQVSMLAGGINPEWRQEIFEEEWRIRQKTEPSLRRKIGSC